MQNYGQGSPGEQPSFTKYFLQDPSLIEHMNDKQQKKIILYDLPQIEQYRKLNKPVVSEQKKRMIKEKLDLEQQSLLQTKQRQKRNQYFLNYSENPFVDLDPHLKNLHLNSKLTSKQINLQQSKQPTSSIPIQAGKQTIPTISSKQNQQQYVYDIVYELNVMRQKDFKPEFLKMKDDFRHIKKNADLLSNKIIQLSSKKQDFDFFRKKTFQLQDVVKGVFQKGRLIAQNKKLQNKDESRNRSSTLTSIQDPKQSKKDSYANPAIAQLPQNPMTFEQIIAIKEQSFFMKTDQRKKLNIFKIAFNKNQKQIIGKQLLNKYYFSFTSMVQKLQKIKIPIYRDISRMARKISLNVSTGKQDRFDYMDSYQLSFKTNTLTFVDLMSVASGRFTPQFVSRTTNFDVEQNVAKQKSETSSQQQQEQIFYVDNTKNVSVRFYNKGEQEQEIINYLKLQCNSRQISYMSQCQQYKKSIHSDLKMKEKLVSTTIQDKDLHGVINKKVKHQLKQFVNMDERDIQVDRLIRMNKTHKNKNVSIKLQKILDAFELKKQHDAVIHKLGIMQIDQDDSEDIQNAQQTPKRTPKLNLKPRTLFNSNTTNQRNVTPQKKNRNQVTPNKISRTQQSKIDRTPTKYQEGNSTAQTRKQIAAGSTTPNRWKY